MSTFTKRDTPALGWRSRAARASVLTTQRAKKLTRILSVRNYRTGLKLGVAASTEHHRSPDIQSPGTVIDIGANRGQFALVALQRFPTASLICFEPLPEARRQLEKITQEEHDVTVLPYALAEQAKTATFHVTADDDSSSLRPTTAAQRKLFPGSARGHEIEVEVRRLDEVLTAQTLRRPVFVKIDVQGTELEVLRGAKGLRDVIDDVLVECSFIELYEGQALAPDVIDHLTGWGLRLAGVHNVVTTPSGECAQADLRFSRPSTRG